MSAVVMVQGADNGGCGACACLCHTEVEDPGPDHLPTCRFADPDYVPSDFSALKDMLSSHEMERMRCLYSRLPTQPDPAKRAKSRAARKKRRSR